MRLAALSDVHGNLPALDAVLDDIAAAGVDLTVNLGDILSGPLWVSETAERLMALTLPTIAGNHERQVLTLPRGRLGPSDAFAAERIDAAQRAWLAALPATLPLSEQVYCCHGTPTDDLAPFLETVIGGTLGIRVATEPEVAARAGDVLRGVRNTLILCGHTHLPRAMQLADGRLIVNPGSVGLPAFDDDHPVPYIVETGSPHARYAVLSLRRAGWQVELRSVPYDHAAAARRAEQHGRGDWADALLTGRVGRREAGP